MKERLFTEAIKVKDGKFYNLSMHINRIQQTSLLYFGESITFRLSDDDIPTDKRGGLFKCRVLYSDRILDIEYIPYSFREINTLTLIESNDIEYDHKWADRNELNRLLSLKRQGDDVLIIKNGLVTDTSFSNVIFEDKTGLYTPNSFLLNGTKRQSLLLQGVIKERTIELKDIASFSKIYIINSMVDLEDDRWLPASSLITL